MGRNNRCVLQNVAGELLSILWISGEMPLSSSSPDQSPSQKWSLLWLLREFVLLSWGHKIRHDLSTEKQGTQVFYFALCESEVTQSCLTPWDPMDCSLSGSSVHRIFQARVLEWVAISFSRGSSRPRDWTQVSHTVGRRFTVWATGEVFVYIVVIKGHVFIFL